MTPVNSKLACAFIAARTSFIPTAASKLRLPAIHSRAFSAAPTLRAMSEYKLSGVTSLDLKPGFKQEVDVEGLDAKLLLVNAGGKVQALGPKCTHYGAPLIKGILTTTGRLTCPWHGGGH